MKKEVIPTLNEIVKQNLWRSFYLDDDRDHPRVLNTNPSVIEFNNKILVATRKLKNLSTKLAFSWRENKSSIVLQYLNLDSKKGEIVREINPEITGKFHSLEDPRLNVNNGKLEVWACGWHFSQTKRVIIQQILITLDQDFAIEGYEIFDQYEDNIYVPEKNWQPILQTSYYIYKAHQQHIVINRNTNNKFISKGLSWKYGDIHGGTQAIEFNGNRLCFFQSSLQMNPSEVTKTQFPSKYFMGAYIFENKPPFKILKHTKHPIIQASFDNPSVYGSPAVIFPSGILNYKNEIIISIGVNDCSSFILRIPEKEIKDLLK